MKYNILKTTAMCIGAFALTACSDWLDTKSPSLVEESVVFNSVEETQNAVYGLYKDLCGTSYAQLQTIHQGTGTDCELIDGIGSTATNQNNERDGMNYYATPSWAALRNLWEDQYHTIEDCNRIIDGINNGQMADNDDMMRYSAEARVIRAMVYLDLIRVFGDIPFMEHGAKSDLSNVEIGKTDRDVILDALIKDLEKVVEEDKLPWCGEKGTTQEHVNMGYAKGLLANICMTRAGYAIREDNNPRAEEGGYSSAKKESAGYKQADYSDNNFKTLRPSDEDCKELYEKAEQQLKEIIEHGTHDMNDSFADFWGYVNHLRLDPKYESMFEIPMGFGNAGELGYTVGVRMKGLNGKITTNDYGYINSSGKIKTTAMQLYSYQPTDTRRDITCVNFEITDYDRSSTYTKVKDYTGENDSIVTIDGKKYIVTTNKQEVDGEDVNVITDLGAVTTIESRMSNKPFGLYIGKWDVRRMAEEGPWLSRNLTSSAKFGYGINVVRMRYPQILLWYAECLAYKGDFGGAAEWVKKVHFRAFNYAKQSYTGRSPIEDKGDFEDKLDAATDFKSMLNMIDLENRLEFCGECFRKWDLIRWNRLHDDIWAAKQEYLKHKDDGVFQTKIYYKYLDEGKVMTTTQKDASGNDVTVTFYYAPEKSIDAKSVTWYGEDGTNEIPGIDIATGDGGSKVDYAWLASNGYFTTKADYNPGLGTSYKGFNGDSYSTNGFGTDYAKVDELPSICGGLVGTSTSTVDAGITIKNRYLMPINIDVINTTYGADGKQRVYNSYGY